MYHAMLRRSMGRAAWVWPLAAVLLLGAMPAAAGSAQGYLGVLLQDLDEALLAALDYDDLENGVLVTEVVEGSPAEKAGIQQGDVILEFGDSPARSVRGLTRRVQRTDPGETVSVRLMRKGKERTVEVELGETETRRDEFWFSDGEHDMHFAPDEDVSLRWVEGNRGRLGVRIESLGEKLGRYFGAEEGVLVLDVDEDSAAEKAGLEPGDVIVSLGGEKVSDTDDLQSELEDLEAGDKVELEILRDRESRTVEAELEEGSAFSVFSGDGNRFFARRGHGLRHLERLHEELAPRIETRIPRRIRIERPDTDELREELEQLREEMNELRARLEKSRDS